MTSATGGFDVRADRYVPRILDAHDVNERESRYVVRRVFLPARGIESFTVIGPDLRPVELIDEYLAWLSDCERSPNTVEAYAHVDVRHFSEWHLMRGCLELGSDGHPYRATSTSSQAARRCCRSRRCSPSSSDVGRLAWRSATRHRVAVSLAPAPRRQARRVSH